MNTVHLHACQDIGGVIYYNAILIVKRKKKDQLYFLSMHSLQVIQREVNALLIFHDYNPHEKDKLTVYAYAVDSNFVPYKNTYRGWPPELERLA